MRIAYLDCFSGISGDMFLGALIAAGAPADLLRETVAALNIGAELQITTVMRSGISAIKADVLIAGEKDLPREVFQQQRTHEHGHEHKHEHEHGHAHDATITQPGSRKSGSAPSHSHSRSLSAILKIIAGAPISAQARATASSIFRALGESEAQVHQVPIEEIHFHEVGAADALADITCAAVGAEALRVDEWVCSPLNVGGGTVECAHGRFPIPAPATVELLKKCGAPVYSSGIEKELVTPTGAAIVSQLAVRFGSFPAMKISGTGYGAGYRDLERHPNVLRLTLGASDVVDSFPAGAGDWESSEPVVLMEANLDDASPQIIGYVMERALAAGALDIFTTPVQMKKNRPGLLVTILCELKDRSRLADLLFSETTTLGVRARLEARLCLSRSHVKVSTEWGEVRVKVASRGGQITNAAPEFEDCRRIAEQHQAPLKAVMQAAMRSYWSL